MSKIVDKLIIKIENTNTKLTDEEISTLAAGFNDILESQNKIIRIINKLNDTEDNDKLQDGMIELQFELVNHIRPHISVMEEPLMKIINALG